MDSRCYFLAYRMRNGDPIDWEEPTGGVVMEARLVEGIPMSDYDIARQVLEDRYHCAPGEILVMAEVYGDREKWQATVLHRFWEREYVAFHELMAVSN